MKTSRPAIQRFIFAAIICVAVAYSSTAQTGRDIARNAFPSVVLVVAENSKTRESTLGSGFFVRGDLIVTNYHVVKGASKITVKLVGREAEYDAEVVAFNAAKDVVILKVASVLARPLPLGDVSDVGVGDEVYVIGNPEGLEATMSQGIVSGIRQIEGNRLFQITAPVSHGSSGGPVLRKSGEVIGVAVGSLRSGQNLNFAIPASEVIALLNTLRGLASDFESPNLVRRSTTSRSDSPATSDSQGARYRQAKIDEAFENVIKQPDSAAAHFKLAEAYLNAGRLEEGTNSLDSAVQEFKRAIQIDPRFLWAYTQLAESYTWLAVFERDPVSKARYNEAAIEANKQAIRTDPDFVQGHVALCGTYSFQHRYEEAIAACLLAVRIKPTSYSAFSKLGLVYNSAARYDDAIRAYLSAAKLNPNSDYIYFSIGLAYQNTKRYNQAIINYQRSIRLRDPREYYTEPYRRLADCYTASRRVAEGIAYFRRLISILGEDRIRVIKIFDEERILNDGQTKSTLAHHTLGMLYARSGNKRSALEQYKILKLQGSGHPESEPAKLAEQLFNEIYK